MPRVGAIFSSHLGRFLSCRDGKRRKGGEKGRKRKREEEKEIKRINRKKKE